MKLFSRSLRLPSAMSAITMTMLLLPCVIALVPVTIKGRDCRLHSTIASTLEQQAVPVPVTKSPSNKRKSNVKSNKKQRKQKMKDIVKNRPEMKNKRKGKSGSIKPLKDLRLGSKVSGKVVDVCDFGVFVNISYATRGSRAGTALLHISQISDKKVTNIRDTIKVGDTIDEARVINIDLKKGEVGLSLRSRRPKRLEFTSLKVGDELRGKVDTVVPYGVFVDVGMNVNPLLHVSRITGGAIENIRHHLNEGDPVLVHIIDLDIKRKTVAVSMLDRKADQYLDRRMSQRLKRYYGTARTVKGGKKKEGELPSDLDYFDQAIRELEEALQEK